MLNDHTTGIPHPDRHGHWLVPPWPADSNFGEVVGHFQRFHPGSNTNTAHLLTYYEGYLAALDAAAPSEPKAEFERRWREDMRDCVVRCVNLYRKKPANVSRLVGMT